MVLLIILGLPVALVLAWMFELTSQGIKRTETADAMPAAAKPTEIHLDLCCRDWRRDFDRIVLSRSLYGVEQCQCGLVPETATVPGKSIAVLPFENLANSPK